MRDGILFHQLGLIETMAWNGIPYAKLPLNVASSWVSLQIKDITWNYLTAHTHTQTRTACVWPLSNFLVSILHLMWLFLHLWSVIDWLYLLNGCSKWHNHHHHRAILAASSHSTTRAAKRTWINITHSTGGRAGAPPFNMRKQFA